MERRNKMTFPCINQPSFAEPESLVLLPVLTKIFIRLGHGYFLFVSATNNEHVLSSLTCKGLVLDQQGEPQIVEKQLSDWY